MGIYLSNMEMPEDGSCIQIVIDDDGKVYPSVEKCILKMGSIAKAVPVPPHGRLGDLDALLMRINHEGMEAYMDGVCYGVHPNQEYLYLLGEIIDATPTIIPAEEGE